MPLYWILNMTLGMVVKNCIDTSGTQTAHGPNVVSMTALNGGSTRVAQVGMCHWKFDDKVK